MLSDVLTLAQGKRPIKTPSKETLNNPDLLYMASGINPYADTPGAYKAAYESLGIDVFGRVPERVKRRSLRQGEVTPVDAKGYKYGHLGFYETAYRENYPYADADAFLAEPSFSLNYDTLTTPVPHRLDANEIARKTALAAPVGLYYYMYYTTLFMWGMEWLGPEVFLTAIALDPQRVDEVFLQEAYKQSEQAISLLAGVEGNPFVFVHDDLADANGPMCSPKWYEKYLFPRYEKLINLAHAHGKKLIFTADGNMACLLGDLYAAGVDGVMLENPATDFNKILSVFSGRIIIGGTDGKILCNGTAREVYRETERLLDSVRGVDGFVLSAPCGLHGAVPITNLEAYFDARALYGITKQDWRKASKSSIKGVIGL